MSDTIVMRHPTLPPDQEIEVGRDAMPHYSVAGWQLVPQEELDQRAAIAAAAAAEAAKAEQAEQAAPESADADDTAADEPESIEPAEPKMRPARRAKAPQDEEN